MVVSLVWVVLERRHEESRLAENLFSQDAATAVDAASSLLHRDENGPEKLLERATPVMNPAALAAAVPAQWTEGDAYSALRHIETNFRGFLLVRGKPADQRMLLLGALVATLDDLAQVAAARDRALSLRNSVIEEFREFYSSGACPGAKDADVTVAEWARCVGGDPRLFANTNAVQINWYEAVAYAALRGANFARMDQALPRTYPRPVRVTDPPAK